MSRFKLPPGPSNKPDLRAMRRAFIQTFWLDYKLFGYPTEAVKTMQKKIIKAKTKTEKQNDNTKIYSD